MKKLLVISAICLLIIGCKKEVTVPNGGIYRGVFREMISSGDTVAAGVCYIALFEDSQSFVMTGDSVSNAPADCNGTYLVDNATTMQFVNNAANPGQFDDDHFLDTVYNYTFDDVNFKFWQTRAGRTYEYDLKRD